MECKVINVSKRYHKKNVLSHFEYTFLPGLYLFTGPNGTGKSTTLKILAQIISPSNQNAYISRIKKAYLCEKIELTNGKPYPFLKTIAKLEHQKTNIKKLMDEWELPNKEIRTLSKGNKQKCAILMLLLREADMYLFDEPTDALDPIRVKLFEAKIEELLKKGKMVIIATHEKHYFESIPHQEIYFDVSTIDVAN